MKIDPPLVKVKRVLGDRILVEVLDNKHEFSDSGLIALPDGVSAEKLMRGRVISIGTKVRESLELGDIVLFESVYGKETDQTERERILSVGCIKAKLA